VTEPAVSEWVQIIHPETGGTGEVHRQSLSQHYAAGWRLLTDDDIPPAEPETEPPTMTRAQAAKAAKQAASADTEEN
jgi:hypothetical protein